jgi:hypothetical protein
VAQGERTKGWSNILTPTATSGTSGSGFGKIAFVSDRILYYTPISIFMPMAPTQPG